MTARAETRVERQYPTDERVENGGQPPWWGNEWPWDPHRVPFMSNDDPQGGGEADDAPRFADEPLVFPRVPANEFEALMICAPHQEPERHAEELLVVRDVIADAIDLLPCREREVFEGVFIRRESLRRLGRRLGLSRTHVARVRDRAVRELRDALQGDPVICWYFGEGAE